MGLGGVISNLLCLGAKLLPAIKDTTLQGSSSSSSSSLSFPVDESQKIETELEALMRLLERIKATLHDAEQREIRDKSVELWLKELKGVAYDTEDVLDEYHYEILRAQVEAREASSPDSHKRKLILVPDDMLDGIQKIKCRFEEIANHRIALRLLEEDGPRISNSEQRAQTSYLVDELGIFGRDDEKEKLVSLLSSQCNDGKVVSVVTIVGTGGLGKTTLAQLAYKDLKARQVFDEFGWVCVSEDFNVERLTREMIESITRKMCTFTSLSALQEKVIEVIRRKRVLLVLDDVWNENMNQWETFKVPFIWAALVKILITTRSKLVADIVQNGETFNLGCLTEEQCWLLFKHHAIDGVNQHEGSQFEKIGKQIMTKCGMLPLAVKSIASLMRYEMDEESWREILESELWETNASNAIFPPLQLSYARLPSNLKCCLIFCSMFPKDYRYNIHKLVELWISQGYIESKGNKSAEQIGFEYGKQLWQRSFLECSHWTSTRWDSFKLHDLIHDLARLNSKNGCFSIEACLSSKLPEFSYELYNLYIAGFDKIIVPIPLENFNALRTLIIVGLGVENLVKIALLSLPQKLRALEIQVSEYCERRFPYRNHEFEFAFSGGNLKHLRYLSLNYLPFNKLPECICSLYNLRNLKIRNCLFDELPKGTENLVSLETLEISSCYLLEQLPESFCQLKTLREVILIGNGLKELPNDMERLTNLQFLHVERQGVPQRGMGKIVGIQSLYVCLDCEKIGWLMGFRNLGRSLCLNGLKNVFDLTDIQCANLLRMHNLESLKLCWSDEITAGVGYGRISLRIMEGHGIYLGDPCEVMAALQPHPNLRDLYIFDYGGSTFPEWIGNPSSCASLERLTMNQCKNLRFLPFGGLRKLKYLDIVGCQSLQIIKAESLPSDLQELHISNCEGLISIPGIQGLKSLIKLSICWCKNLQILLMDVEPSFELTMRTNESSYQNSLLGLRNLTSLRSLNIYWCPKLQLLADELLCVDSCEVLVNGCPLLKEWCLQHNTKYNG